MVSHTAQQHRDRTWMVGMLLACFLAGCGSESPDRSEPNRPTDTDPTSTQRDDNINRSPPIARTVAGSLRGEWLDDNLRVFRGVRYAAAPVGERRWRAPGALKAWSGATDATRFGPACVQPQPPDADLWSRGRFEMSEDCLHLNIWSAATDGTAPVMVWFHGGAHTGGYAHAKIFDGVTLANLGAVVVTVNYRLGAFGFLAHPVLADESGRDAAGNYGLLDKIAALDWINDNIAAFGGNPDNVTIFGQSAGSWSVCALMASKLSRGLFHRAIGQSAACFDPPGAPDSDPRGRQRSVDLAKAAGFPDNGTAADLRSLSVDALLDAEDSWRGRRMVVDGFVLTEPPLETFLRGDHAAVPLMVGSTADEGNGLFPRAEDLELAELQKRLARIYGDAGTAILAAYRDQYPDALPGDLEFHITENLIMAWGMRTWARLAGVKGQNAYLYFMSHAPPAFRLYQHDNPDLGLDDPRSVGAYHSGDLAYVFGNVGLVGLDWQQRDRELADQMSRYWVQFARTGDPNQAGLPNWPAYNPADHPALEFGAETGATTGIRQPLLDPFDALLPQTAVDAGR